MSQHCSKVGCLNFSSLIDFSDSPLFKEITCQVQWTAQRSTSAMPSIKSHFPGNILQLMTFTEIGISDRFLSNLNVRLRSSFWL